MGQSYIPFVAGGFLSPRKRRGAAPEEPRLCVSPLSSCYATVNAAGVFDFFEGNPEVNIYLVVGVSCEGIELNPECRGTS